MFSRSVTHNMKFSFNLQQTCFGSVLSHHQAFSKISDAENLKLHSGERVCDFMTHTGLSNLKIKMYYFFNTSALK